MRFASLALLLLLASCAHKREVQASRLYGNSCTALGHETGSDPWLKCTMQLERARKARIKTVEIKDAAGESKSCDTATHECK